MARISGGAQTRRCSTPAGLEVREFLASLLKGGAEGRTVARKLSSLRQFYRFLLLDGHLKHDPTLDVDSPKQWKVLPKSLAREQVSEPA